MAKIVLKKGDAPPTPVIGKGIAYVKSDGLWYSKDDAGVETLMSGGSDGSVDGGEITGGGSGGSIDGGDI
jgi:hypothetical protein